MHQFPHTFFVRATNSLAAPIFIALVGFILSQKTKFKSLAFIDTKLMKRGALTLLIALLIDLLIWHKMPLKEFDALYLISFCIFFSTFLQRTSTFWLMFLFFLIILTSHYLLENGYYVKQLYHTPLSIKNWKEAFNWNTIFCAGWFPLFPWLGIFLLGYIAGRKKVKLGRYKLIISLALIIVCIVTLIIISNQNKYSRSGYSELFYPADLSYLFFAICALTIIWINLNIFNSKVFYIFRILGRTSLFLYIIHLIFIRYFIELIYYISHDNKLFCMFIFYIFIYTLAFLMTYIKDKSQWKKTPYFLQFFLGS